MTFNYAYAHIYQVQQQRHHANLHQALFETEQTATRVAATLPHDPFAAGVVAHFWLKRIEGLGPNDFPDITQKRAWSDAVNTLTAAAQRGRAEQDFTRYLVALQQREALLAQVGGDPEHHVQVARSITARKEAERRKNSLFLKLAVVMVALSLPVGIVVELLARRTGGCCFAPTLLGGIGVAIHSLVGRGSARRDVEGALERQRAAEAAAEALRRFMADLNSGQFIDRMDRDHPLLARAPDVMPPPSSSAVPSVQMYERVVERQVVVTRCRFCSQMTPTGTHCQNCGAPL